MKTTSVALVVTLATATVLAQGKTQPLSKTQCDKLDTLWWHAETQLGGLNGCRSTRCNQVRLDLQVYQATVAGIWANGKCDRHYGTRQF